MGDLNSVIAGLLPLLTSVDRGEYGFGDSEISVISNRVLLKLGTPHLWHSHDAFLFELLKSVELVYMQLE